MSRLRRWETVLAQKDLFLDQKQNSANVFDLGITISLNLNFFWLLGQQLS